MSVGYMGEKMKKVAEGARDDSGDRDEAQNTNETDEARENANEHAGTKKRQSKPKYIRRTIELHPAIDSTLRKMQNDLQLRSQTEVIQKAVQLLAIVMGDEKGGRRKIFVEKKDGKLQELLIL